MLPSKVKPIPNTSIDLLFSIDLQTSYKPIYDAVYQLHGASCYLIPTGGGDDGKESIIPYWNKFRRRPSGSVFTLIDIEPS